MILYIVYLLLWPVVIIFLFLLSFINSKIRKNLINGIRTRVNAREIVKQKCGDKEIIIMHAASAGEFEQLKPILRDIDKNKYFIVQTFLSSTIYDAESNNPLFDVCCYHPLDFPVSAFIFLNSFNPKIYLTTRHDIWPHHLVIAKLLNIKCYLINANLYENSKRFSPLLKSFNKFLFDKFDQILTGSEKLKSILTKMSPAEKIVVTGDSRFDQIAYRINNAPELPIFNTDSKYIILGSIDNADLPIIKDAMANFKNDCKYIIVPHEVNKSDIKRIEILLDDISIKHICLSQTTSATIDNYEAIIVDSVGILLDLYKYADIAYVGAGFSNGVHSVIEPLAQSCVVCYGPKIDILDEAIDITNLKIGHVVNNSEELLNIFKLIKDVKQLEQKQNLGVEYINMKLNASKKIIAELNKA